MRLKAKIAFLSVGLMVVCAATGEAPEPHGDEPPQGHEIRTVIANGGYRIAGGAWVMTTTIGQSLAFPSTTADFQHSAGFWAGTLLSKDMIFRDNFE